MKVLHKTLLLSLAVAAASPAFAYEAGDIIVRGGVVNVSPDVGTDAGLAPFKLDVEDNTQLGLTATYMVTPKIGVELLAATPFEHHVTANGTVIGSTNHLPPTVSLQFYPLDNATVQPYIGAGINYTFFFEDDLNAVGQAATSTSEMNLTSSVGLALEAGIDVKVAENVVVNASVWKIDINTDLELDGVKAGEIELDPLGVMIAVGYKF